MPTVPIGSYATEYALSCKSTDSKRADGLGGGYLLFLSFSSDDSTVVPIMVDVMFGAGFYF